ncbi:MAG: alpha/beta hydrolase [bacterium]|nr:alpha/beta hydrolase [bacterium]MXV91396.1 alpha/beta hydrolase [Acidimicrobiia bacterium]MYC45110.1 alpha/beta hydrolase [Acidimicrobiia bacterium]
MIDQDRHPIAWREAGEGPPVIFLHGLGGTRTAWDLQLRGLADRFRCIAWDMPGYGASAPLAELTFPATADSLAGLLDTLGLESAHLVGLSFGGMHALHTAIRHPGRVRSLVLADTSPAFGLDGTTAQNWQAARLAPLDAGLKPAEFAGRTLDAICAQALEPTLRSRLVESFGRISPAAFRAAVECLPAHDVRGELADIGCPVLVIVGEADRETPVAYAEALAGGLTHSTLEVLEGVGHLSPAEAPERFNRLVGEFLSGVEARTGQNEGVSSK